MVVVMGYMGYGFMVNNRLRTVIEHFIYFYIIIINNLINYSLKIQNNTSCRHCASSKSTYTTVVCSSK